MNRWLTAAFLFASAFPAAAADQIKLVVPFAAGGPVDLIARTIAGGLPAKLGADVIIENRGGAGGVIGTELVAKAAPDGRTMLQARLGSDELSAALRPKLSYDRIKAFTTIVFVGVVPSLLVVSAQAKIDSLPDLFAAAKRKAVSYGSAGPGTTMNIAAELFGSVTGTKTTHVPYRGAGPALNDLLGGHLDMIIADTPVLLPLVNTNAVRPLALFAAERSPLIPDVATTAQLGYPEIVMENWYGVLGPAGLTPSVRATLEKAILEVLASPDVTERFAAGGLQGAHGNHGFMLALG